MTAASPKLFPVSEISYAADDYNSVEADGGKSDTWGGPYRQRLFHQARKYQEFNPPRPRKLLTLKKGLRGFAVTVKKQISHFFAIIFRCGFEVLRYVVGNGRRISIELEGSGGMEHEVAANKSFGQSAITAKGIFRGTLLGLVWISFLGSNYLTITHLTAWLKTDHWPSYSTANLFSAFKIAYPKDIRLGVQPVIDWIMTAPAAYTLMGLAIALSISMVLLPDD